MTGKRKRLHTLTIVLDDGLYSYLRADFKGIGLHNTIEEAAVFLLREAIIRNAGHPNAGKFLAPYLPKRYRKHFGMAQRMYATRRDK